MGAIIHSSNLNVLPKMPQGVLEADTALLQNYVYGFVMKDFVIKKGVFFVLDPVVWVLGDQEKKSSYRHVIT